jgi:AraC-like DNA-binding protein
MKTKDAAPSPRIKRIRKKMYDRELKVTEVARQLGYTRQTIHRAFREEDQKLLKEIEHVVFKLN